MNILLILHTPWTRELGLAQCSIELADAFRALGHHVDKYDIRDAFPRPTRLSAFFEGALFARRAVAHVRQHGHRYDVIQAEQGNLPVSKHALGYNGVLVCRTDGLVHFFEQWRREHQQRRVPSAPKGRWSGNLLRWLAARLHGGLKAVERSFAAADVIVLLNRDELEFVSRDLRLGEKAVLLPNGLSDARFRAFAAASRSPPRRLREQKIVAIGHLGARKGVADFPAIVREVRTRNPAAHFALLGTGMSAEHALSLFAADDRPHVDIVEHYTTEALPELLADATAGMLPSYLEGFPLGVLELLAAWVPTVAYDVPGPRELLRLLPAGLLTPRGDVVAMAEQLCRVLSLPEAEYAALTVQSRSVAERFRWRDIAEQTIGVYESARQRSGKR